MYEVRGNVTVSRKGVNVAYFFIVVIFSPLSLGLQPVLGLPPLERVRGQVRSQYLAVCSSGQPTWQLQTSFQIWLPMLLPLLAFELVLELPQELEAVL
jgi:hypothetical protein